MSQLGENKTSFVFIDLATDFNTMYRNICNKNVNDDLFYFTNKIHMNQSGEIIKLY